MGVQTLQSSWKEIDALLEELAGQARGTLADILQRTQTEILTWLQRTALSEGLVGGPNYQATVALLDREALAKELRRAGWDAFQNELSGYYSQALQAARTVYVDIPLKNFTGPSIRALHESITTDLREFQKIGVDLLDRLVRTVQNLTVAPLSLSAAASSLSAQTGTALSRSYTLVNTGLASVQRRLHNQIAEALPEDSLLRVYLGPQDRVTRPFCEALAGKAFSESEIQSLSNGTSLPPLTGGGGWNCRHVWMPITREYAEEERIPRGTAADLRAANAGRRR